MNNYFSTLRSVSQSVEGVLADQYKGVESMEIKQTANHLNLSVQACLKELTQSSNFLRKDLQACLVTLDSAEDKWQSKQQVAEIDTSEVLEAIGQVVGYWNQLQQQMEKITQEVIELEQRNWTLLIEELREKFFLDPKTQEQRVGIGWGDKDRFKLVFPSKLKLISNNLDQAIQAIFRQFRDSGQVFFEETFFFVKLLDVESQLQLNTEQVQLLRELQENAEQVSRTSDAYALNLYQMVGGVIEEWNKRFGEILWKEIEDLYKKGLEKIEERVELIIHDRLKLLEKCVQQVLLFFNDLLEKQYRYQQEMLTQHKAEKVWLDQQRHQVKELLADLEKNLNLSIPT
ncbi:hypothetical protein [Leptolyngbya sp. GGD]|uniref:hypothetical protein n=1 Tax=Leptolyngbya sp. GGD TaxID=2997907 RepID=UPI00227B9898|nr:hypothetical protein [Leptolyngbya sp. GGD]MCY6493176.1 hypothetical protein [Leptolyngbya sp. GGD]